MTTQFVVLKTNSIVDIFSLMADLQESDKILSWDLYDPKTINETIPTAAPSCRCEEGR